MRRVDMPVLTGTYVLLQTRVIGAVKSQSYWMQVVLVGLLVCKRKAIRKPLIPNRPNNH